MKKNSEMQWIEATVENDGAVLWPHLGPVISSKDSVKEMGGYPIYTNERQTWLLCVENGSLIACGSIASPEKTDGIAWMDYAWVRADKRGNGLWSELTDRRMNIASRSGFKRVRTCTAKLARPLEAKGFKAVQQRGSWTYLEMEVRS